MARRMVHFNHCPRKLRKLQVFKAIIPTGTIFGKLGSKELKDTTIQKKYFQGPSYKITGIKALHERVHTTYYMKIISCILFI